MERVEIRPTQDGSFTLWDASVGEHFHSGAGAFGESMHVFINQGLNLLKQKGLTNIGILEVGFGTGLNALLTLLNAEEADIQYTAVEKFPVGQEIWQQLFYESFEPENTRGAYQRIMQSQWGICQSITDKYMLKKLQLDLVDYRPESGSFDLIYFDAFSAAVQPELWSEEIFARLFEALAAGGVLVTYSSKGSVKQALRAAGFKLERLPGYAGKRHMLRATKP